jgi:hypothetical protein
LEQARVELELAVEMNPSGWDAHAKMITVGKALGLPHDHAHEHFQKSVELRPRFREAYWKMFDRLRPRWGGSRRELLDFALQCLDGEYWDNGIPDFGRQAIDELTFRPHDSAHVRTAHADPDLWEIVQLYYESGQECGLPEWEQFSLNIFAKYGAYGRHFEDVAETFQKLEQEGADPRVFWDSFTYGFLRDLVFSKTDSGPKRILPSSTSLPMR